MWHILVASGDANMSSAVEPAEGAMTLLRRFLSASLGWLIAGVWFLCQALLIAWAD